MPHARIVINFRIFGRSYGAFCPKKISAARSRCAGGRVAGRVVGVQPAAGRSDGAGQRRGLLPYVRRAACVGILRPSPDDGAARAAGRSGGGRRAGRAPLLHAAAAALPLCFLAARPPGGGHAPRCGALRRAVGRDAHPRALRLHRRARRPADDDRGALPLDLPQLRRAAAPGLALDGRGDGRDGLQQVPRGAGGDLLPGGQPAPAAAPRALRLRRRGPRAPRPAPALAVRTRLGVVRLPPRGAQLGLPPQLPRGVPAQRAGGLQPPLRAALCSGLAQDPAAERPAAGAEAAAARLHRLLPPLVAARLRAAAVDHRRDVRSAVGALRLCPPPPPPRAAT